MKALLLSDYTKLSITEMPVPGVGDDEVLVRVRACGICGSDVHGYDGSTGRRIPPLVMGHEAAGVIERTGSAVSGFSAGDRVTFDSTVSCGRCDFCRRGQVNLCDNRMVLGVSCGEYRRHGAFAEFVSVPARILYRLPDALPFEQAALIEAVSIAVHAVQRHVPKPDDAVLVIGCGMIGVLVIQVLRDASCRNIVALDVDDERRAMAQRMGASRTLHPTDAEVPKDVDVAFEVVGRAETVQMATKNVRRGGTVVLIGNLAPRVEMPLQEIVTRELSLLGSCGSSGEYPKCIELLSSGAVNVAPLISATVPLEEGPDWFERLHRGNERLMKVILQP